MSFSPGFLSSIFCSKEEDREYENLANAGNTNRNRDSSDDDYHKTESSNAQTAPSIQPENCTNVFNDVLRVRELGRELFISGRYADACTVYGEGLKYSTRDHILYCNRAVCWSKLGLWEQSVKDCNRALKIEPSYNKARFRRAASNEKLERWAAAVSDFEVLRGELPEDNEIAESLRRTREALNKSFKDENSSIDSRSKPDTKTTAKRFVEAFQMPEVSNPTYAFQDRTTADGNKDSAIFMGKLARVRELGRELFSSGRYAEACTVYGEGLKYNTRDHILYCNRAICWSKLGLWEQSVKDCDQALKIEPSYTKARFRRAVSNEKLERWAAAVSDFEVLRGELPENNEIADSLRRTRDALNKLYKAEISSIDPRSKPDSKTTAKRSTEAFHYAFHDRTTAVGNITTEQKLSHNSVTSRPKTNYIWVEKGTSSLYEIPKEIKNLFEKDIVPGVLKKHLSPSTYKEYFAALLYAEDYYHEALIEIWAPRPSPSPKHAHAQTHTHMRALPQDN
ncbi:hypothetical protein RJ639_009908 [Escallonia herrerae]|uniref:Uncharacterized protein n=1 Tax=Escallonia herrerae TaxID=1293975 RepID=A0AA88VVC2_9ASTE|nr:hypothetical protein RJ639_009908 [Escallonia herrerae]